MRFPRAALSTIAVAGAAVTVIATPLAATAAPASHTVAHARHTYTFGAVVGTTSRLAAAVRTPVAATAGGSAIQPAVDLRANAPAVGDQGNIGACVTWALDYSIMGYWANVQQVTGAPFQAMSVYRQVAKSASSGSDPLKAISYSQNSGVDTRADYWQGSYDFKDALSSAEKTNAKNYKLGTTQTLWLGANQGTAAQTAIEQALSDGDPVGITFGAYDSFEDYTGGLYTTDTGINRGGHMVAVYGYDADGIFLRNSWGTSWGDQGDAHVAWSWVESKVSGAFAVTGITAPASSTAPAPVIRSMSRHTGSYAGGDYTVVTGTNLDTATSVTVGGVAAQSFTIGDPGNNTSVLGVYTPAYPGGKVALRVTTPRGTSTATVGTTNYFTYTPAAPTVSALSVNTGPVKGGTKITVTGTNFISVSKVTVGTVKVTPKIVSATTMTLTVPKNTIGAKSVTVYNTGGTSSGSSASLFYYGVLPPS